MIIDRTYFDKGIRFIPNHTNQNAGATVTDELDNAIDVYSSELLRYALGIANFDLLKTALQDLPNADQKLQDLVNGVDYTINSVTYRYGGLKEIIADFVYCRYFENDNETYTTTGVVQATAENAVQAAGTPKYIRVWQEFIYKYQNKNRRGCNLVTFDGVRTNEDASLYDYLKHAFSTDYFKFYENKNSFGI